MASTVGNQQNPWTPYDNYKDCSLGICSIYCPQFCYLIFPPPPQSDDDSTPFSPLIIAIISVLASAFLLVSYYTIVTRYCKRPVQQDGNEETREVDDRSQWSTAVPAAGLDEASIRNITVCKYRKGDGLIEGNDCAVCLSEFQENESLRLLPKCDHAFHLPCIDTWLRTHSNCPLCRASAVALAHPSPNVSRSQVSPTVNVNAYEMHRPNDLVLVVDDGERNCDVFSGHGTGPDDDDETRPASGSEVAEDTRPTRFRRSTSLGTFSYKRQVSISDVMKIDEDLQMGCDESCKESGSSKGLLRSPVGFKRSVSTGRLVFTVHDKAKNSILPS